MNDILLCLYFVLYCLIGCIFNGFMNEENQNFSFLLMLCWPLVIAMAIPLYLMTLFISIGRLIQNLLKGEKK